MSPFAQTLAGRFERFRDREERVPLSIKLRSTDGCFDCGGCNPVLQAELDRIFSVPAYREIQIERHESGPEWIVYATAALLFLDSVSKLITTVLQARREGQAKGDRVRGDVELIIRGLENNGEVVEERVVKISSDDSTKKGMIKNALSGAIQKMLESAKSTRSTIPQTKKVKKPMKAKTSRTQKVAKPESKRKRGK